MKGSKTIAELSRFPLMRQLRAERQRRGIRLIELAEDVGYHRTAIGNWERCKHLPTLDALDNWCQALGLNLRIEVEKPKPAKQEALDFDPVDDRWKSEAACREVIRERMAAGGSGWEPK